MITALGDAPPEEMFRRVPSQAQPENSTLREERHPQEASKASRGALQDRSPGFRRHVNRWRRGSVEEVFVIRHHEWVVRPDLPGHLWQPVHPGHVITSRLAFNVLIILNVQYHERQGRRSPSVSREVTSRR